MTALGIGIAFISTTAALMKKRHPKTSAFINNGVSSIIQTQLSLRTGVPMADIYSYKQTCAYCKIGYKLMMKSIKLKVNKIYSKFRPNKR